MPFRPGAGRPKGVPNKATREIKAFWHAFFRSKPYRETAKNRMLAGRAPHLESYLLALVYGKPKETVEVTGAGGGPVTTKVVHEHHAN